MVKKPILEDKHKAVISKSAFAARMARWLGLTMFIIFVSLAIGVLGYRGFEGMAWIDALLNASMILGGMGEVDALHTIGGKLFASFYALYSGILLVVCGGLLLVPVFHRVLHHFHAEK